MIIKDRTAVVTGGASGLGLATARRLALEGARLALFDRSADVKNVAREVSPEAMGVEVDVSDAEAVVAGFDRVVDELGIPTIIVNCAGTTIGERIASKRGPHQLETFMRVINVNLVGTFNVSRIAAALIAASDDTEEERGVIVNTASIAAFDGQVGQVAYTASKGAIAAMTLPMARDLAKERIRVVTVAPGIFDTPLLGGLPEEMRAGLHADVPHPHRLGQADEFAALVAGIVQNAYLNGETIRLDGGLRMAAR